MSAVEVATQEVARSRAAMIRAGIQNYLHTLGHIAAAYQQRDWKALGYDSWDGYVDGEYSEHRLKLSPEHRQKAVAELRLAGMSQRAIGSALGVDQATVIRDLRRGDADASPDEIQGADGKTYASTRPSSPAGPIAPSVSATDNDQPGHDHPSAPGEEPTPGLATAAAVSEAPTVGAVGAGDDAPAAPSGTGGAAGAPGEPVRVRIYVETGFSGASHEDWVDIPRDEWDGMTPAQRRDLLDDHAETLLSNHIDYGWHIDDEADYADTADGAQP